MAENEKKKPWTFDHTDSPQDRQIRAVEYIAYYLDRIEGHLAILATATKDQRKTAIAQSILTLGQTPDDAKKNPTPSGRGR